MPYVALSFVVGQVLTAAQMNQLQENITLTRNGHLGPSAPSAPVAGTLWWDNASTTWIGKFYSGSQWVPMLFYDSNQNETGIMPPGGEDWGSIPTVVRGSSRTDFAGAPWTPKNMLLNGSMAWWQRGNSFQVRSGRTYTADRWMLDVRATSGTLNVRQSTLVPTDGASIYSLEVQVAYPQPTLGSNDVVQLVQPIEGTVLSRTNWTRPGAANRITRLSFQFWSGVTGLFTVCISNSSRTSVANLTFNYTTASAWDLIQLGARPVSGTVFHGENGLGCYIGITLAAGSNMVTATPGVWLTGAPDKRANSGQLQGISTSGTIFRITDVQWELGEVATPFEMIPAALELPMLRRYYNKTFDLAQRPRDGSGLYEGALGCVSDDGGGGIVNWPVIMRTNPTVTLYNPRSGGAATKWLNYSQTKDARHGHVLSAGDTMITITMTGSVVSSAIFDRHLIHATAESELF